MDSFRLWMGRTDDDDDEEKISFPRRVQSCLAAILFLAAFLILVANLLF